MFAPDMSYSDRVTPIPVERIPAWSGWIGQIAHDFYHTAEYHALAQARRESRAFLCLYGHANRFVAWPHLLVPVSTSPGLEGADYYDVSSVYGYPGPLVYGCEPGGAFLIRALSAIKDVWYQQKAVSAFTRTQPLLFKEGWLCDRCRRELRIRGAKPSADTTVGLGVECTSSSTIGTYGIQARGPASGCAVSRREFRRRFGIGYPGG